MGKRFLINVGACLGLFIFNFVCSITGDKSYIYNYFTHIVTVSAAYASDERHPYGGSRRGAYGEKKEVLTIDDARKILKEYFLKRDVKIGEIKEKEYYFEAEILDRRNNLVDKVIIDKRTGRIRSIY